MVNGLFDSLENALAGCGKYALRVAQLAARVAQLKKEVVFERIRNHIMEIIRFIMLGTEFSKDRRYIDSGY